MSNFPENDMNEKIQDTVTETDEFSTVFGDPSEHNKKAPTKRKKSRLTIIIAAMLSVAILVGGTVAVIKLIPEREEDTTSSPGFETIKALELDSKDFKSVKVTNSHGTFKLYSETEQPSSDSFSSSDTSSATPVVNWYLDGYDKDVINTSSLSSIASAAATVEATREITTKTASECGFDTPVSTVEVVTNDNAEFSILIGGDSPDNSGVYLMLPATQKIYLVDTSVAQSFNFDPLSLADTSAIPGVTLTDGMSDYKGEDGTLAKFDSITVTGTNFPETVVIEPNTDKNLSEYAAYMTTAPTKRIADNVDSLFNLFKTGVSVSGAYSFDTSAGTVAKLGLNSPDFAATIKIGSLTQTYKFKLQDDGNYAVIYDGAKLIKKVAPSSLEFINYKVNNFYASWVSLQSINDLSNFTVKTPDKTYSFDIEYDDSEDAEESYIITYNGNKLTAQYFQNFYQYCISLSAAEYTVEPLSKEPDLSFVFTYKDTSRNPSTVSFRKSSETKYQYSVDGIDMGKITSSAFAKIQKYAEKIASGKDIK